MQEAERKNHELEKARTELETETRALKKEREKLAEEIEQMGQEVQEKPHPGNSSRKPENTATKSPTKGETREGTSEEPGSNRKRKPSKAVQIEESSSEESETWEKMQEGPIDVEQKEYSPGAHIRLKNAIAEGKDTLDRNRYIEKQRSSRTIKIIRDPVILRKISNDLVRGSAQEVLFDMCLREETYYGTIIQYLNQYMWKLEDSLPMEDGKIWDLSQERPVG